MHSSFSLTPLYHLNLFPFCVFHKSWKAHTWILCKPNFLLSQQSPDQRLRPVLSSTWIEASLFFSPEAWLLTVIFHPASRSVPVLFQFHVIQFFIILSIMFWTLLWFHFSLLWAYLNIYTLLQIWRYKKRISEFKFPVSNQSYSCLQLYPTSLILTFAHPSCLPQW